MPTPASVIRRLSRMVKFGRMDHRKVFQHIHDKEYWGNRESVSGPGSSVAQTENIHAALPDIVARFGIDTLFDAPCGDLYWMADLIPRLGARYIGGDIVPDLIETARARNTAPDAEFRVFDIVADPFPACDLWLCRDVLFHLSFSNIRKAVENFGRSTVPYVLVTSHIGPDIPNRTIATGDFRQLNLFKAPFLIREEDVLYRFEDYAPPAPPREMILLRREVFARAL